MRDRGVVLRASVCVGWGFWRMQWTDAQIFQLIDLYKKFPCLFDASCDEYRNRRFRNHCLETIANELHTTDVEILKKIKYLRSQFGDELKKNEEARLTDKSYTTKWKYFNALLFLRNHITKKMKTSTSIQLTKNCDVAALICDSAVSSVEDVAYSPPMGNLALTNTAFEDNVFTDTTPESSRMGHSMKRKRKTRSNDCLLNKSIATLSQLLAAQASTFAQSQITLHEDPDTIFGKLVEAELRKIISPNVKRRVKKTITDAIYEAQSNDYDLE